MNFSVFFYNLIPGAYFTSNLLLMLFMCGCLKEDVSILGCDGLILTLFTLASLTFGFIFYGIRNYFQICDKGTFKNVINNRALRLDDTLKGSEKLLIEQLNKTKMILWNQDKHKLHDHYSTISTLFTNLVIACLFSIIMWLVLTPFYKSEIAKLVYVHLTILNAYGVWFFFRLAISFRRSEHEILIQQQQYLVEK